MLSNINCAYMYLQWTINHKNTNPRATTSTSSASISSPSLVKNCFHTNISLEGVSTNRRSSSSDSSSQSNSNSIPDDASTTSDSSCRSSLLSSFCSQPLGEPLPYDEHACSVSLPTWSSVVGFGEGDYHIVRQLKCGYPRIVYHPYIRQLMNAILKNYSKAKYAPYYLRQPSQQQDNDDSQHVVESTTTFYMEDCLPLPTKLAAIRCQTYLQLALNEYEYHQVTDNALIRTTNTSTSPCSINHSTSTEGTNSEVRVIEWSLPSSRNTSSQPQRSSSFDNKAYDENDNEEDNFVYAVLFPTSAGFEAKAYWQHTGEIVSSRRAERILKRLNIPVERITYRNDITKTTTRKLDDKNGGAVIYNTAFYETLSPKPYTNKEHDCDTMTAVENIQQQRNIHDGTCSQKKTTNMATTITKISSLSPHEQLRQNIAKWSGIGIENSQNVFLLPSGMASIYQALRCSRRYLMLQQGHKHQPNPDSYSDFTYPGGTAIVYGFPYSDTLKLCSLPELSPGGVEFFGHGCPNDYDKLEHLLQKTSFTSSAAAPAGSLSLSYQQQQQLKQYSALFTEVPSNPLLKCPDLYKLRALADQNHFALVVDDTISNFVNVDVLSNGIADLVCTSLTKIICGRGDTIAGCMIANPFTERGRWMQQDLMQYNNSNKNEEGGLHTADAVAMLINSSDFLERNELMNENAELLADWLHSDECPDVDKVYYPKFNHTSALNYQKVMRPAMNTTTNNITTGHMVDDRRCRYGDLMSIVLHKHVCHRTFYDVLDVPKGPSLGTNFTLVCPYTLIAHHHELDFALRYNVPPNLIRISVGLEPISAIQSKFRAAFELSRLHPKSKTLTEFTSSSSPGHNLSHQQSRSYSTSVVAPSRYGTQYSTSARQGIHNLFGSRSYQHRHNYPIAQTIRSVSSLLRRRR